MDKDKNGKIEKNEIKSLLKGTIDIIQKIIYSWIALQLMRLWLTATKTEMVASIINSLLKTFPSIEKIMMILYILAS